MSKDKLLTIIVTTIVNITAAAIFNGILRATKNLTFTNKLRDIAKRTLTKKARFFGGVILLLALELWGFIYDLRRPGPPSRVDVFWIVLGSLNIIAIVLFLWASLALEMVFKRDKANSDS